MPSRSSNPTGLRIVQLAASLALSSALLYLAGGCAGGGQAAREDAALDAYVKGVMAYQKGDTDRAMTNLQAAVNKKNDLVMARSMLGDLHRSRSEYDAAREQYEVVTRLDPYEHQNH